MTDSPTPPVEVQLPDPYNDVQAFEEKHEATAAILTPVLLEWEDTNAQPRRVRDIYPNGKTGSWRVASWAENRQRMIDGTERARVGEVESEVEAVLDKMDAADLPDQPISFEQALDAELARLRTIMVARQRKYGHRNISRHGQTGVATRFADKAARIDNIYFDEEGNPRPAWEVKARDATDESIDDTWIDSANYAVIALMVRHGTWGLPLDKENK